MKKYALVTLILFMIIPFFAVGQAKDSVAVAPKYWKISNKASINITQAGFSNWADGSENSFSLGAFDNFTASYNKNCYMFDSYINLAYGMMKMESYKSWKKVDDKIEMMANNSWKMKLDNPHWFYGVLFTLNSQFANGYKYDADTTRVSSFLSPVYVNLAPSITYRLDNRFSWIFSPANLQLMGIMDQEIADAGIYGNKITGKNSAGTDQLSGDRVKLGLGFFTEVRWTQPLTKGIDIDTKLRVTNNYIDPRKSNRWNFDVNYMLLLNFAITKYVSANVRLELVYDDDINIIRESRPQGGPILQLKEVVGIGFAWSITN